MNTTTRTRQADVEELHRRCGIYTKPEIVEKILDAIDWRGDNDLTQARLLEPAAGDGAFVVEAARRLIASCARHGLEPKADLLRDRILAFEIHPREAARARSRVVEMLVAKGVHWRTADACARAWIVTEDFLLTDLPPAGFTHVAGNPPYVRWSKIPPGLKAEYERNGAVHMNRGDLFLPFLDRGLESLETTGRCGFLCSDRWRYMAFAERFREKWMPLLAITSNDSLDASDAFVEGVDSYPTVLIASKRGRVKDDRTLVRTPPPGRTLAELGCVVKVGPALGHTPAFILEPDELDVEPQLLLPWLDGSELSEGGVAWRGRRVIAMHSEDGKLIDLRRFPLLRARLQRFREALERRSIVRQGAPWFRPIDRVRAIDWTRPKLLIPELAKVPRLSLDRSGAVPSHAVYAIFVPADDIEELYRRLQGGRLAQLLFGLAPQVKGGYVRCYKRILNQMRL
jgi:hypothetical protein